MAAVSSRLSHATLELRSAVQAAAALFEPPAVDGPDSVDELECASWKLKFAIGRFMDALDEERHREAAAKQPVAAMFAEGGWSTQPADGDDGEVFRDGTIVVNVPRSCVAWHVDAPTEEERAQPLATLVFSGYSCDVLADGTERFASDRCTITIPRSCVSNGAQGQSAPADCLT